MKEVKFSYYPGCSLECTSKEYDQSLRAAAEILDIDLKELPDWNCCGASSGHCTNHQLSLALPARNLALAEKEGQNLAVACAACFLRFKQTNYELQADDTVRQEIEKVIGMPYKGSVEVRHLLDIFSHEVGLEEIQRRVKKPLKGLKLAAYYGCYLVRPPEITQFDDPENPMLMDDLLNTLGAEAVDWSHKVECCGGNLLLARADIVIKLVGDICEAAAEAGAAAIVTACPLCQANLDTRQPGPGKMPILHFSELLGLALGVDSKTVHSWWKKHINSPGGILKSHNLS
ncbi:CoB--CoM heterodisulfide reductase iron-sulfur subunit B family protein [Chloroflexota bacterium]